MSETPVTFSSHFARALAACARSQVLVQRSVEAAAHAREARQSARLVRRHALETRQAWKDADASNQLMQRHVATVAREMRAAGMTVDDVTNTVRAHIRFVLYDGGMREMEAEPVVARAVTWVADVFRAA